ncbi:MAG: AI-2E family transporter [Gemmatimonadetes bacterium]|nr:AI-2E family transporter [Gemmatimonadota bacterium]
MIFERMDENPGARFLLVLACLVVVVAGLRAAAPILVPFSLALFLAIVSMPVMFGLRIRRVPAPLAILLTVLMDALIFGLVILMAANSVGNLNEKLPRYRAAILDRYTQWIGWLDERSIPASEFISPDIVDPGRIFDFVGGTISTVASLFSLAFLVGLVMVFILAEATVFPFKFQAILGGNRSGRLRITKTIGEVQAYLGIKTLVSLATGLLAGVFCWMMGLDFPVLLGLTAFVLNFVPTIGSIIAAAPAMVLALILQGPSWMFLTGLGYLAINTLFGNILEPNLMGRRLGLSTLVVVLSLLFWGWLWGPVGALLSVPLTMVVKIILENTPDLRWLAVLLDNMPPQAYEAAEKTGEVAKASPGAGEASVTVGPEEPTMGSHATG